MASVVLAVMAGVAVHCRTSALAWISKGGGRPVVMLAVALGAVGAHRWGVRGELEAAPRLVSVTAASDPIDVVGAIPPQPGQVLASRYRLRQLLGAGGMGFVFSAVDEAEEETVALKVLRPELSFNPRWVDRMQREVRMARTVQHPHVCRVMSFRQVDGYCFLTMELATGGNLSRELRARPGRKTWEDRVSDVHAILLGLAAVHDAGIVHRDLTPHNILRFRGGRLAIADFGLAVDQPAKTTLVAGTPNYMAPEIVAGGKASCASDVWQLGVIMHEVLFGRRPEPDAPAVAVEPRREPLQALCAACLHDDPARRPANAGVVARAFSSMQG